MNIALLPKVELHCHLDGIVTPAMVRDIQRTDPDYPINADEFERAYPITGMDSFFNWRTFRAGIDGRLDCYFPIIQRYIEQLKAQNVRYFELMVPLGLVADPVNGTDNLRQLRAWVNECEGGTIQVEFLIAFGRHRTTEETQALEASLLALHDEGLIVGISLAGLEVGNPARKFTTSFARWHDAGLKIEIHAGEWVGAESVWDALDYGYPDRIGHGVTLFDDPRLVEVFQERQIHIEMCPTSNLQTGSVARIEDHPIRKALDAGLNVSINTDDPGIFRCSMDSEYALITQTFGFTEADWMTIYRHSLAARFQPTLRGVSEF